MDQQLIAKIADDVRKRLDYWSESSEGYCYSASFAICVGLARNEIPARLLEVEVSLGAWRKRHWCVEVGGLIVDVTADQFNADVAFPFPRVLIHDGLPGSFRKLRYTTPGFSEILYFMGDG